MGYVVTVSVVMAYIVMSYMVMADAVMVYVVMADIVMAEIRAQIAAEDPDSLTISALHKACYGLLHRLFK